LPLAVYSNRKGKFTLKNNKRITNFVISCLLLFRHH
jgi:hypothetical protein